MFYYLFGTVCTVIHYIYIFEVYCMYIIPHLYTLIIITYYYYHSCYLITIIIYSFCCSTPLGHRVFHRHRATASLASLEQDHPQRDHVGLIGEVIFPNLTLGAWTWLKKPPWWMEMACHGQKEGLTSITKTSRIMEYYG